MNTKETTKPKFKITVRDLIEFDHGLHFKEEYLNDYKLLQKDGHFRSTPLKLDETIKLGKGNVHINFKDQAFFLIGLDKFETYNLIGQKSRTIQTLNWIKFLFNKFGKAYAPYGKEALKAYIKAEKDSSSELLDLLKLERTRLQNRISQEKEFIDFKKAEVKHLIDKFNQLLPTETNIKKRRINNV